MFKFLRSIKLPLVLLAVVVLLIFLNYFGILTPLQSLAAKILNPVQTQAYALGTRINNIFYRLTGKKESCQTSADLENEVKKLTIENASLKTTLEENQQLLKQYNFLTTNKLSAVPARVIGKNPESNLQALILDKGSADGLAPNLALIAADGTMVGKILQAKSHTSEAILINDSRSRVAAVIQNESNSRGVVVGEHGLSLKMELIPQNEKVNLGDIVVTSGLEEAVPKGLVLGKVSRTVAEANSFFQTAWIQPLLRLDNLTVVSVIKSANP